MNEYESKEVILWLLVKLRDAEARMKSAEDDNFILIHRLQELEGKKENE